MKGLCGTCPFIGLLILNVINRFIFGHGVVIYYVNFIRVWMCMYVLLSQDIMPCKDFALLSL